MFMRSRLRWKSTDHVRPVNPVHIRPATGVGGAERVIPARASRRLVSCHVRCWIPVSAGMTMIRGRIVACMETRSTRPPACAGSPHDANENAPPHVRGCVPSVLIGGRAGGPSNVAGRQGFEPWVELRGPTTA